MQSTFLRTLRALESDRSGWGTGLFGVGITLLVSWIAWAVFARVGVTVLADHGRLEGAGALRVVQASEAGEVVDWRLSPGAWLGAGDTLARFDDRAERSALDGLLGQRAAISHRQRVLTSRLRVLEARLALGPAIERSDTAVASARYSEADIAATHAEADAERVRRLAQEGFLPVADYERLAANARRMRAAANAMLADRSRSLASSDQRRLSDESDHLEIYSEMAELESDKAILDALIERATLARSRRIVRAPVAGRVVRVAETQPGSMVAVGETLVWIAPGGAMRVIAEYRPSQAVGIVRPGQPARVRPINSASPSGRHVWAALVDNVCPEPRGALVRVELSLSPLPHSAPLPEHGLPVLVDIEIGRASPVELLMRAAGHVRARPAPSLH